MSDITARKWKHKGKTRYQPTQGALGLYQPKDLCGRLTYGKYWAEEIQWRLKEDSQTPALYNTPEEAIRAGRRFVERQERRANKHPEPCPPENTKPRAD